MAIEGIDGAGTSSQAARLTQRLNVLGHRTHLTAEPSDGPVGRLIRQLLGQVDSPPDPGAMALLFAADRLDHLQREIRPALAAGTHVVSDRYLLSSLAYQSLENPLEWVETINKRAPAPDLTLLIAVEAEVAETRRTLRGSAAEIYDAKDTQRRLVEAYAALAQGLGTAKGQVVVLDGAPDFDTVAASLEGAVLRFIKERCAP